MKLMKMRIRENKRKKNITEVLEKLLKEKYWIFLKNKETGHDVKITEEFNHNAKHLLKIGEIDKIRFNLFQIDIDERYVVTEKIKNCMENLKVPNDLIEDYILLLITP